ncbi:beta-N-acetylhexosaminidase [Actinosynnema sp. NPDC047251]|uniref:beta-N-acetylhexosaminidase n=1 Tax=Saccharothrix espanaensis (strain ATCC 51144 / DSM 44229 / JCM 9112 / NBRC 15066 / NRRL 15764) TaxID=1179773 RepID=K0JPF7_SACES|nr:beta-N-acetylhexosaminidase [Saccharothrix espanaensis]CCH28620.1 beta-N-acetylhexosaminidase [Saccharothrix espanaensis DSM 44229]
MPRRVEPTSRAGRLLGPALAALLVLGAASTAVAEPAAPEKPVPLSIVPAPVKAAPKPGVTYSLTGGTRIHTQPGSREAKQVGEYLAGVLRPSTGFRLPVVPGASGRGISLLLTGADHRVGKEGYQLDVTRRGVVIRARTAAGLFAGVQTLRQLLPAKVESKTRQRGPWNATGVSVLDYPRYEHRGAMLDVARHFFSVDEVKRYIDQIAQYKVNRLHLHLTDDQGWRLEIKSWPNLTKHGGSTEVGGGPGGFYTQDQYRDLVAYAASRHIEVIPEIDLPGHTNAALSSYAELNCDGVAPPLYTGIEVGFSSLCIDKDITYKFVDDVLREVAALTPGKHLHIGGDEALVTTDPDFIKFMDKVLPLVRKHGKVASGWHEFVKATPDASAVPQFWGTKTVAADMVAAAARGNRIVLSPATKAYLDMKYDENTKLGLKWAGYTDVEDAYDWNPGAYVQDLPESAVRGVEAPLWSETLTNSAEVEYMAFPRLPAIAELGWSPWSTHDWAKFKERLAAQGPRWKAQGVNFYPSPQVPWK